LPSLRPLSDAAACRGDLTAAIERPAAGIDDRDRAAWYRLDALLDEHGSVSGQALTFGSDGSDSGFVLGSEASASGPLGDAILVVSDDGRTSTVEVVDARDGCVHGIGRSDDVIRRAILSRDGRTLVEHRVDRTTRRSLGIWERPLEGSPDRRLLAPIASDARFGRTFSTELDWTLDGRLAIQSCGESACRTEVIDRATGVVDRAIDDVRQGEAIAVSGTRLVSYESCPGLPCPIVAVDLRSGARRLLAERAGLARVLTTVDGPRLVHEVDGVGSGRLRSSLLDGTGERLLRLGSGGVLAPASDRAAAAMATPPGWLLVSSDGRPRSGGGTLVDVMTGATLALKETSR
jgi:hypothetical protein